MYYAMTTATETLYPTEAGARLFKYRPLGSQLELEHVLDILERHRLYVSPPRSFNDPFDCMTNLSFEGTEEQKLERAARRIMKEDPSVSIAESLSDPS